MANIEFPARLYSPFPSIAGFSGMMPDHPAMLSLEMRISGGFVPSDGVSSPGEIAVLRKSDTTYSDAGRILYQMPDATIEATTIVGGFAVEAWTGGSGTRPSLSDIDISTRFPIRALSLEYSEAEVRRILWDELNLDQWLPHARIDDMVPMPDAKGPEGVINRYTLPIPGTTVTLDILGTGTGFVGGREPELISEREIVVGAELCRLRLMSPQAIVHMKALAAQWNRFTDGFSITDRLHLPNPEVLELLAKRRLAARELYDVVALLNYAPSHELTKWAKTGLPAMMRVMVPDNSSLGDMARKNPGMEIKPGGTFSELSDVLADTGVEHTLWMYAEVFCKGSLYLTDPVAIDGAIRVADRMNIESARALEMRLLDFSTAR